MQQLRSISTLVSLTASFWVFQSVQVTAQIIPDNSLGNENSVVVPNVNINGINSDRIDGGAIRGSNLFHSFQEFNIDNGRGAYFSNPGNISNILSRVTGNNLSNILGTLGVLGNANLFLINPNGIVFGPNARLDVGGSFFASTADGVLFENGVEFAASNPEAPPLLTINIPIGLNFRENPGNIVNQATLTTLEDGSPLRDDAGFLVPQGLNVPQNQTLALVGGNVLFDNGVAISPGSNIELGGLSEPGIVELNNVGANSNTPILQFPDNIQQSNIALTHNSQINIRADDGGDININSGNFEMSGGSIIRAGIDEFLGSPDAQVGTTNVNVQDTVSLNDESFISNIINTDGIGKPGEINLTANSVLMSDVSALSTSTFGQGNAGDINMITNSLLMTGNSGLFATPVGQGNAGNVTILASDSVQLINSDIFSDVAENSIGNSGNVTIETGQFQLIEGSQIITSNSGQGNGGNITILAGELVEMSGTTLDGEFSSALFTNIEENGIGNAGNIIIKTPQLQMTDGADIVAANSGQGNAGNITIETAQLQLLDGAQVSASTNGEGNAGTITVKAENIQLSGTVFSAEEESINSGFFAQSGASGNAGTVIIEAERLRVTDGGSVSVAADNTGDAGTIIVRANDVELLNGLDNQNLPILDASVKPENRNGSSGTGRGGSVIIEAERLVLRNGGRIEARTANGTGESGQVSIFATESVELSGILPNSTVGSSILTDTTGRVDAGDITIITPSLSVRDRSSITAISDENATGNAGDIRILATDTVEITGLGIDEPTVFVNTGTNGAGNGGNIRIETARLTLAEGIAVVATSANNGSSGKSGNVNIYASQSVELTDSGIFAATETTGDAGNVTIQTDTLRVLDESIIAVSSLSSEISDNVDPNTPDRGDAGNVNIYASESVELTDSGIFAATQTTGDAGNVTIQTETLQGSDGSIIRVDSDASGIPGNVNITATSTLLNQSSVSAASEAGQGGSIRLQSNDVRLLNGSEIRATGSESGETFEGNIEIDADLLVLLQGSEIITNAFSPSGGSNINIQPFNDSNIVIIQSNDSVINAAGNLTIDSSVTFKPAEVPEVAVTDPNDLIAQEFCRQRGTSQFTITGRGGIAVDPNDKADGNQINVDLVEPVPSRPRNTSRKHSETDDNQPISSLDIIPARGWIRDENGDVILVGYDPTKTATNRQPTQLPQCQH